MGIKEKSEEYLGRFDGSLTILEFEELFKEAGKFFSENKKEKVSEDEKWLLIKLMKRIFWKRLAVYENYIDRWERGLFFPNDKELEKLKNHQKNLEKGKKIDEEIDKLVKESPSLADKLEQQKKETKETKKKLDKLLKDDEPRQKAEELLKKYKNNPPFSGNNSDKDIENKFNEQITNLQNQIRDLENKQNQDSNLEKDHKYKKELERLKKDLEDLKRKNSQKTSPTSSEKKNDNFPYGGLIICGVVLIIVLLLVFFFFFTKKNQ